MSNQIVRALLENSKAFLNRLLILPIGREQEEEVIGKLKAAGLASDKPAEGCLFLRNPGFIRRIELGKMPVTSIHVLRRFILAQERPGLEPLNTFQTLLTGQEQTQLVKDEPGFGVATSFTEMIGRR